MQKIRTAAVIGSGIMGGGIAALLAGAGINTLLLDIVPRDLSDQEQPDPKARNAIVNAGLKTVQKAKPPLFMHPRDVERITVGNLEDDFDKLRDCDWIVEVIVENLEVKRSLFQKIERIRSPQTIVSTNTSGIPLSKISEGMSDEFCQYFLGTHFFNPVRYMKLLEIIPGKKTLPDVLALMARFGEKTLGKGIVWAKDTPNFIGNRVGVHGIVAAMHRLEEMGISISEADALFGPVLGRPKTALFKTCDLVGLDTMVFVAANTYKMAPQDEQRDLFKVPQFVQAMVEKKLLGNKSGSGFYLKEKGADGKPVRQVIDPQSLEYGPIAKPEFPSLTLAKAAKTLPQKIQAVVYGDDPGAKFAWRVLAENLIYAANRIPEIADSVVEIDNAMRWGYNFELGPFETWDAIGVEKAAATMTADGMTVPEKVQKMLAAGHESFYRFQEGQRYYYDFATEAYRPVETSAAVISLAGLKSAGATVKSCKAASLVDLGEGVFCVEFHTKMNVIKAETVDFMVEALDFVGQNGVGMVIGNQAGGVPGAFSAGADLKFMGGLALAGRFDDMTAFVAKGQSLMQQTRYADFPVVAAPYGLTFGGACELCLGAVDKIVAHADLFMGLVEVGVGLIPAGGGCLNLWKKTIATIPEAVTINDYARFFEPVLMTIAQAKVSSSAADARTLGFLGAADRIVFNRDYLVGEAKKEVLKMADDGYVPSPKRKLRVLGQPAMGLVRSQVYNMQQGGYISEYDAYLAEKIAYVISGGDVAANAEVEEEAILALEREAFVGLWKQTKTQARIRHMLETGRPLRN